METCTLHVVRVIYDCAPPKAARNTELCFLYNDLRSLNSPAKSAVSSAFVMPSISDSDICCSDLLVCLLVSLLLKISIVPRALSTMRADEGYGEKRKLNYCNPDPYNIGRQAIVMIYRVKIKDNAAYPNYLRVIAERTMPTLKDPRPLGPL